MNIRLVSNITKDGSLYTLLNIKVLVENAEAEKRVEATQGVNAEFTSVNDLFTAIQTNVVNLVSSGLV